MPSGHSAFCFTSVNDFKHHFGGQDAAKKRNEQLTLCLLEKKSPYREQNSHICKKNHYQRST